jgi:hypothetical protein
MVSLIYCTTHKLILEAFQKTQGSRIYIKNTWKDKIGSTLNVANDRPILLALACKRERSIYVWCEIGIDIKELLEMFGAAIKFVHEKIVAGNLCVLSYQFSQSLLQHILSHGNEHVRPCLAEQCQPIHVGIVEDIDMEA